MSRETILIDLLKDNTNVIPAKLKIYEESLDNEENVLIEIEFSGKKISKADSNLFSALQAIRRELEQDNIIVQCNGAARNVYPSAMQMSMGSGRMAYILKIGCPARLDDAVDIFDKNDGLNFVYVDEQEGFYSNWVSGFSS